MHVTMPRRRGTLQRHVFDLKEKATHNLVAKQLRDLADQFDKGAVELAYDESHAPTGIVDPVNLVLDLTQNRNHVELLIRLKWDTA